jgi:hypothetical protein
MRMRYYSCQQLYQFFAGGFEDGLNLIHKNDQYSVSIGRSLF